jgi:hypothetical protein
MMEEKKEEDEGGKKRRSCRDRESLSMRHLEHWSGLEVDHHFGPQLDYYVRETL